MDGAMTSQLNIQGGWQNGIEARIKKSPPQSLTEKTEKIKENIYRIQYFMSRKTY